MRAERFRQSSREAILTYDYFTVHGRVVHHCFSRLSTPNDPPRNLLTRSVCTSNRAQTIKRRCMLSSKVDVLLRHTMSDRFDIFGGVSHAKLKVAVAPIAGKLVIAPLGRKKAKRRARLQVVVRQPGVVWLKELLKPTIASFAL